MLASASETAQRVREGSLTAADNVAAALSAIDGLDRTLEAWVYLDQEGTLAAARSLDADVAAGRAVGPLAGITVGVKDIFDVAGMPTRFGAAEFAHKLGTKDSGVVARLKAAGAIILGKTATTQFAYLDPARTRNPWNAEHTPGGSSSGSAAAVAAGMCQVAIGSQTVGSVLRPAAYCGIVGLKPTYGLVSKAGVLALATSLDHTGIFARSVADLALVLSAVAGHDSDDPRSAAPAEADAVVATLGALLAGRHTPRLGLLRGLYAGVAGAEVAAHLDVVAEQLAARGAEVVEVELSMTTSEIMAVSQGVHAYEAAGHHREWFAAHAADYGANIRRLVETGMAEPVAEYERARSGQAEVRAALMDALADVDCLLLPVAPSTAPRGLSSTGDPVFCAPASVSGLPSIALPSGLDAAGMPLAVQLIGRGFGEAALLEAAAWVEAALDFRERPPMVIDYERGAGA